MDEPQTTPEKAPLSGQAPEEVAANPAPVMDVQPPVQPAPAPELGADAEPEPESLHQLEHHIAELPKPPKQPGNNTTLAIVATVIIVLGLAALITYAYLQSK